MREKEKESTTLLVVLINYEEANLMVQLTFEYCLYYPLNEHCKQFRVSLPVLLLMQSLNMHLKAFKDQQFKILTDSSTKYRWHIRKSFSLLLSSFSPTLNAWKCLILLWLWKLSRISSDNWKIPTKHNNLTH